MALFLNELQQRQVLPSGGFIGPQTTAAASIPQPSQPWWERWNILPVLGGIGGAIGGSFLAPGAGTIGGGAAGAGLGELLEQALTGKGNIRGLATETALGGLGGVGGRLLGAGRVAAPALKGAGKEVAAQAGKKGILQSLGAGARRAVLKPQAAGPFFTEQEAKITGTIAKQGLKGAPRTIGEQLPSKIRSLSSQAKQIIKGTGVRVDEPTLKARLLAGSSKVAEFNQFNKTQVKLLNSEIDDLIAKTGGKIENINDFKLSLGNDLKSAFRVRSGDLARAMSDKEAAKIALWDQLDDIISSAAPDAKDLTTTISTLIEGAPGIQKAAEEGVRIPVPFAGRMRLPDILGRPLQAAMERGGGALEGAGIAPAIPSPAGRATRAAAGQIIPRALTGGIGQQGITPETEMGPFAAEQIPNISGIETTQQQPIISQQQAIDMIFANPQLASAIKTAYQIGQPTAEAKAGVGQEFLDKAQANIAAVLAKGEFGYGPLQGRLAEAQIGMLGGLGTSKSVVELNQRYNLLKLNILRAYQGARISDKDFELARLYIPSISDTPQTAQTKLVALRDILLNATPQTASYGVPGASAYTANE